MDFEFNFGQQTVSQGVSRNEKIYASVAGVAIPLSHEELVFMDRETGKNTVMTHQVLHALSLCQQFKPMHEHIVTISQNIPELKSQTKAVEQVTKYLIKNNLLVEDIHWKQQLAIAEPQQKIAEAGIVVRSCDRPQQLKQMLDSLVNYQKKFNTKFQIQIYDDSSSEKHEKELERVCSDLKNELNIHFYGAAWQKQFITMLKTEFDNLHQDIDWLLAPKMDKFTGGRVWNFALLNNAGKKFLFFDDDYLFEPRVLSQNTNKVDLTDKLDLNVGFALSLSDIKNQSISYDKDVLKDMLNSCGQTVGNWVSTCDVELSDLNHLNLIELNRVSSNSVIKSTGNGTWGSPRANSNYWLYFLEGEQKQEFWKTRETYLENIEASNLLHYSMGFDFLSISKFSPSAIDNSTMTPFAYPINRVEDHFFNALMLFCYPNQVSLHYPVMMGHIQTSKRVRSSSNHIARRPNFNKFVADYALTLIQSTDAQSPELRLKTIAKYVAGLADASDQSIHNRLKEYLSQIRSDLVLTMQQQMAKSSDAPIYWQADVRELIEANGKAVLENDAPVLDDWDPNLTSQECIDQARLELQEVSSAMEVWPEIWNFCKTK
jgi:hypothetical protein